MKKIILLFVLLVSLYSCSGEKKIDNNEKISKINNEVQKGGVGQRIDEGYFVGPAVQDQDISVLDAEISSGTVQTQVVISEEGNPQKDVQ